ncbi:MAG: membrane protein insertion efficiency factor YidD [Candidatus Kerfeldbacteria bacterium RIFOXYA2_FULL_38_24]|uniref:Putative membrane protein insertion efficiency factor n=1 Tax=Candidatus Kerfeldbacteria bacterium RIFOXYB2_FULL_38_14 TaxID=1798547 RepID=A0A1G2BFP7_9BACT|nr:MAG: membrane protein insertion efficiency factor YidD [Candidatus Kerfeldbacteria bacterium RIFOXYB2_FULL_38_14]OGY88184.1 MAG: membrane protein insertion efficiency factor YidD [Candidatus Kerfeldbacteria bacterium RIFOXYA2_FULL_38_24]OGY89204.1 MAG: membrane protein insertion efficiency factor YidD [Candidatus Kerfeldbacteria bacterium RIFOXYC2_FULL_38_9]
MKKLVIAIIQLYQKTISPDHGVFFATPYKGCRFYPSCSEYTLRAIKKHGLGLGGIKGLWRILRCNPFSAGGVDEPIKK